MHTIAELLKRGTRYLEGASPSPRLDCEVLLCHTLACPRSRLLARPDEEVQRPWAWRYARQLRQRRRGVPVAYLTGEREFWSLSLRVNPSTLIPRPETEDLVALALSLIPTDTARRVVDLGTGSGAIALAIAKERPLSSVTAVDSSAEALVIAQRNAEDHHLRNIRFLCSNWFDGLTGETFDLVLANPPYVAEGDTRLEPEVLTHEPFQALISGPTGFEALERIAEDALGHLAEGGHLIMEHGPGQSPRLIEFLKSLGYHSVAGHHDLSGHDRIVHGQFIGRRAP